MPFYAIKGVGIFAAWDDAKKHIIGVKGAKHKKFESVEEAATFAGVVGQVIVPGTTPAIAKDGKQIVFVVSGKNMPKRDINEYAQQLAAAAAAPLQPKIDRGPQPNAYVLVYTDGGCRGDSAGSGVYWADEKLQHLNVCEKLTAAPITAQRAELLAILRAVETRIKHADEFNGRGIHIHTDSEYSFNTFTHHAAKWRASGWVKANGSPPANLDLIIPTVAALEKLWVKWEHIPSHEGIVGNERADELATKALAK